MAGGGFADSYNEIRGGKFIPGESFDGHGGEMSASVYHLFNPADLIPLNLVVRGTAHYSVFDRDDETASNFQLPPTTANSASAPACVGAASSRRCFRRWRWNCPCGMKANSAPTPAPTVIDGDRELQPTSHLFWAEAALSYTLPKSQQNFYVRITAGTSVDADRFSAYRLGGFLPLIAEFPLSLPGYFYQEISARQFVLLNANYLLPLDPNKRWNLALNVVQRVRGLSARRGQPGNWLNGVGGGILYRSPSDRFKIMLDLRLRRGRHPLRRTRRGQHRRAHAIGLGTRPQREFNSGATQPLARLAMAVRRLKTACIGAVCLLHCWTGAHMVELADTLL